MDFSKFINAFKGMLDLTGDVITAADLSMTNDYRRCFPNTKIKYAYFVQSPAEAQAIIDATPTQQDVFNTWKRFSHRWDSETQPALPDEINAWGWDDMGKQFYNTTNSSSYIGLVSPQKYSDYTLECQIRSTNDDNDMIGVVIAFYVDPATGREYTLDVYRSTGGVNFTDYTGGKTINALYGWAYNYIRTDAELTDFSSKVTWGDGSPGSGAQGTMRNWNELSALPGGNNTAKIRVVRAGDIIKVQTSQFTSPNTFDPNTEMTIDLNSSPKLAKFKGPQSYGFSAFSQQNSYWLPQLFSSSRDRIYDLKNKKVYVNNNGVWAINNSLTLVGELGEDVLLADIKTGRMYWMLNESAILASPTMQKLPT